MSTLTVHLINDVGLDSSVTNAIRDRVTLLLSETIRRAKALGVGIGGITGVRVLWEPDCIAGCAGQDVVIRFRRPPRGARGFACRSRGDGGWVFNSRGLTTINGQGTTTLVFVPECSGGGSPPGDVLGSLAFHEFMHNKLQLGNRLHSRLGVQLGAASVGPTTPPSDGDVRLLGPHLGDQNPQICVGGRHPQICGPITGMP